MHLKTTRLEYKSVEARTSGGGSGLLVTIAALRNHSNVCGLGNDADHARQKRGKAKIMRDTQPFLPNVISEF